MSQHTPSDPRSEVRLSMFSDENSNEVHPPSDQGGEEVSLRQQQTFLFTLHPIKEVVTMCDATAQGTSCLHPCALKKNLSMDVSVFAASRLSGSDIFVAHHGSEAPADSLCKGV